MLPSILLPPFHEITKITVGHAVDPSKEEECNPFALSSDIKDLPPSSSRI